jgi:hypothetical protein
MEFAEICNEMLLGGNVAFTKALQIGFVEGEEFHAPPQEGISIASLFE